VILLKTLTEEELASFCAELGVESYRARQIFQWMWQKGAADVGQMTNLPLALREEIGRVAQVGSLEMLGRQESRDGTLKCLFRTGKEHSPPVEAVLIPDFYPDGAANRLTVCVSSQVGCMFGCAFCATGRMGYFRNLEAWEIADQVNLINQLAMERYGKRITNVVYMGMGEPLHNLQAVLDSIKLITHKDGIGLSPKRITVSTVGLAKQIRQIADMGAPFQLAISLHAADDQKRDRIMPINQSLDLDALRDALVHYHRVLSRPVTYEYLLFDGFNDAPEDAARLAGIAGWIPSKVNIIMYNHVAGVELRRAREGRLNAFLAMLVRHGVTATVRRSRGDDIDAGCGQLAIREGIPQGKTIAKG
jgi:23S rRNA (adenine2503-C2)-methyltransferase